MRKDNNPLLPNVGLALLLLGVIASWLWMAPPAPTYRLGYALLGLVITMLAAVALVRPPARGHDARWWVYGLCLVSVVYAAAYRYDAAPGSLMPVVIWGRVLVQFVATVALLGLGRSYAMLPALRVVRTGFLYRRVRHPVYALYLAADLGTVALQPSAWNAGVALVGATVLLARARLEEQVLRRDRAYVEYMRHVRWRFFPGLY